MNTPTLVPEALGWWWHMSAAVRSPGETTGGKYFQIMSASDSLARRWAQYIYRLHWWTRSVTGKTVGCRCFPTLASIPSWQVGKHVMQRGFFCFVLFFLNGRVQIAWYTHSAEKSHSYGSLQQRDDWQPVHSLPRKQSFKSIAFNHWHRNIQSHSSGSPVSGWSLTINSFSLHRKAAPSWSGTRGMLTFLGWGNSHEQRNLTLSDAV